MPNVFIYMSRLDGTQEYTPDSRRLRLIRPMVGEIETHEGALADENVANDTSLQYFSTLLDIE